MTVKDLLTIETLSCCRHVNRRSWGMLLQLLILGCFLVKEVKDLNAMGVDLAVVVIAKVK